jgi:molybdopterin biosynthesis enzyme
MRTPFTHVSVQEAIAAFSRIALAQPKRIPLVEASGLRLAQDVVVRRGAPAQPMALHDGWAVRASQTAGATRRKARVLSGSQALLDAWAFLPDDADAVAPLDHVVMRQQARVSSPPMIGRTPTWFLRRRARASPSPSPWPARNAESWTLSCAGL